MKILSNQRNLFTQKLRGKESRETVLNSKRTFFKTPHFAKEALEKGKEKRINCSTKIKHLLADGSTC